MTTFPLKRGDARSANDFGACSEPRTFVFTPSTIAAHDPRARRSSTRFKSSAKPSPSAREVMKAGGVAMRGRYGATFDTPTEYGKTAVSKSVASVSESPTVRTWDGSSGGSRVAIH